MILNLVCVLLLATSASAFWSNGETIVNQPPTHGLVHQESLLKDMLDQSTPPATDSAAIALEPLAKQSRIVANQVDTNQQPASSQQQRVQPSSRSFEPDMPLPPPNGLPDGPPISSSRAMVSSFKDGRWVDESAARTIVTDPTGYGPQVSRTNVLERVAQGLFGPTAGKTYMTNGELSLSLDAEGRGFFTSNEGYPSSMRCSMNPKDWDDVSPPSMSYSGLTRGLDLTSLVQSSSPSDDGQATSTDPKEITEHGNEETSASDIPGVGYLNDRIKRIRSKYSKPSRASSSLRNSYVMLRNSRSLMRIISMITKLGLDNPSLQSDNRDFLKSLFQEISGLLTKITGELSG